MYQIGREAEALLTRSHGVTGRLLASVNGSPFTYPVVMEKGEISVNGSEAIRRKLSATIKAYIDSPECDVFRTEIRAEYGIIKPDLDIVWVPVGVFVVTEATEVGEGKVDIKGEDRWRRVANARFLSPAVTSGNTAQKILDLIRDADARITATDYTLSGATHRSSVWERDRDKAIMDLSRSIGAKAFFSADGTAVLRNEPSLTDDKVVWEVGEGEGGALIESRRGRSQARTYNAVVAEGERPDGTVAVRAVASITSSNSPLLFGGLGLSQKPRFYRSTLMTTTAQAQSAASALLRRVSGVNATLELDSFAHPGLDADDIILVEVSSGVWEKHVVESFTLPLEPGGVSISTRTPSDEEEE